MDKKKQSTYYPPETAGRLMTGKIPVVSEAATINDVRQLLFEKSGKLETLNYIYVVDSKGKLKGAISIKEIFRSSKNAPVKQFLSSGKVVSVWTHADQEKAALLALKHNIKAIPVVDKKNRLLGVVPSDIILGVLHNENIEDALRFAGAGKFDKPAVDIIKASAILHFRKRIPWLVLGLLGGVVAAFVVEFFENALKTHLILVAFIPAIVYIADAVGAQTQIIFIRSLALNYQLNIKKYIWREVKVNILLALVLGSIIFVFALLWWKLFFLGAILGISILVTVFIAMIIAIFLPWLLLKLKCDPAVASGPFATVIRDIMSLLIYFGIISLFL